MSALTVSIDRCRNRLWLRRNSPDERARLVRLHRAALGSPLEAALDAVGIREEQLVCVKRLHVEVRVRPRLPEATLVRHLADAIAGAVARESSSHEIVVYESRAHAVSDLVRRTVEGDTSRVWAWQQLGLCDERGRSDPPLVVIALLAEPTCLVPILTELAQHPSSLVRFASDVGARGWRTLVRATLHAHGIHTDQDAVPVAPPPSLASTSRLTAPEGGGLSRAAGGPTPRMVTALRRSRIAGALLRLATAVAPSVDEVAALALLETDPAVLLGPQPHAVLRMASAALHTIHAAEKGRRRHLTLSSNAESLVEAPSDEGHEVATLFRPGRSWNVRAEGERGEPRRPQAQTAAPLGAEGYHAETPAMADRLQDRPAGATAHAGLFFLLHLVPEVVLPHTCSDGALAGRSLRWTLYQLARLIVPAIEATDAAALGFAGLPPNAPPPDGDAVPVTEDEMNELNALRTALAVALDGRLGPSGRDAEAAMLLTIRRHGVVVADPGWLDVRLSLDDVSTDVRRAGLDCNPEYLSWLGVVVRFIYE